MKPPKCRSSFSEGVSARNQKRNIIPFTRIKNFGKLFFIERFIETKGTTIRNNDFISFLVPIFSVDGKNNIP